MLSRIRTTIYRLLRASEKHTKTDMLYLSKGGFWLSLGQFVATISGLILAVGFANLLPQEAFGTYKFVLSLIGLIGALSLSGMGGAIVQAVSRGYDGEFKRGVWTHLKWNVVTVAGGFIAALYYFLNENMTLALSMLIAGSLAPIVKSTGLFDSFLTGKKAFREKTFYNIIRTIFPVATLLTTLFLTDNPVIIVAVYFASNALSNSLIYFHTLRTFKPSKLSDKKMIGYGKHLSFMNILTKIANQLDTVLVFHFLGAAQVAIYSFALTPPSRIRGFTRTIDTLIFPKLANRSIPELQRSLPRKAIILFLILLLIVVLYILAAPFIFQFLFPQYLESVRFSQVLALMVLLTPSSIFSHALMAHTKKKELYTTSIVSPLSRIVLLLVLLPLYGIWGAIAARLLSGTINFAMVAYLFKRL